MKLKELAESLGVVKYPELLEEIYPTLGEDDGAVYNREYIIGLQEKYNLLGPYADLVLKGADEIKTKPNLLLWARLGCAYVNQVGCYESRLFPIPVSDGSLAMDMLPVLVLLSEVPTAVKLYEARGFNEAQIKKNLDNIRINIWVREITLGRPMLDQGLFGWLSLYMKALIFDHKAFNFQPNQWPMKSMVIRNKNTGEFAILVNETKVHKSGRVLGSKGCESDEDSFTATFTETADAFIGHCTVNGKIQRTSKIYHKTEWESALRPGDDTVGLHIPRKTNLDPEYVSESLREGLELTKKYYPEFSPKFIICGSWLLCPELVDILGPDAKLSKFNMRFLKYPLCDTSGAGCLGYVWPGNPGPVENYEEDTTLQRGIKKMMLNGEYVLSCAGLITEVL